MRTVTELLPPLLLELDDELLLDDELEDELEDELLEFDVPPQAPKLVQDASLPGTVLVYQFASYKTPLYTM